MLSMLQVWGLHEDFYKYDEAWEIISSLKFPALAHCIPKFDNLRNIQLPLLVAICYWINNILYDYYLYVSNAVSYFAMPQTPESISAELVKGKFWQYWIQ